MTSFLISEEDPVPNFFRFSVSFDSKEYETAEDREVHINVSLAGIRVSLGVQCVNFNVRHSMEIISLIGIFDLLILQESSRTERGGASPDDLGRITSPAFDVHF
jgi:hypothetical protein